MNQDNETDENEWVVDEKNYHEIESTKYSEQKPSEIVDVGTEDHTSPTELINGSPLRQSSNKTEMEAVEADQDGICEDESYSDESSDDDDESLSNIDNSGRSSEYSQYSVGADTETEENKFVPKSDDSYDEFLENLTSSVVIAFFVVVFYKLVIFIYYKTMSIF
jgi:hypothetical protein